MNNFFIIILDGVGIGELPDAILFNDCGSNTLANIAAFVGGLDLPNMQNMGLGNISTIRGINKVISPLASYGKLKEVAPGKDSTTGHWELSGLKVNVNFPYYPNGFPKEIVDKFISLTGCNGILCNKPASGTKVIEEFGDEHIKLGFPIVYTSADSVFQIAAHEDVIPLNELYRICEITRNEIMINDHAVGRIIARPFIGTSGKYKRTTNRKDFSLDPPDRTILDICFENNINTIAIGKINDLFNDKGIKIGIHTKSNSQGMDELINTSIHYRDSLVFTNLVDFDVYFGHRNDPSGFADALKEFDLFLPSFLETLDDSDALIITADHGNDPTTESTDHSREYVPLLFYKKNKKGSNLGIRSTFSDVGKTAADFFNLENNLEGDSFLIG